MCVYIAAQICIFVTVDGGSVWLMDVTFDKAIRYYHKNVLLDAEEYYGEPYHIRVRFSYPKNEEDSRGCKIVALEGSINSTAPFLPTDYMAIERLTEKTDREEAVVYQGEKLKFNRSGQMLLPPNAKLSYYDADVKMRLEQDTVSNHIYRLTFRSRHFRFKPRIEFSLGRNYALKGKSIDYLKTQSKDLTMGFDFGYTFPTKSKMRIGIFTGVALSNSEVNLSIDDLNYYYYAGPNLDVDGDSYKRYYEVSNMKQTINLKMLMIPLYFDFDFLMSKSISTYLDIGVKAYSNLSNKVSTQLDVYKYGIYPKYQNLFMDESWLNRFGSERLDDSSQQYDFVEVVKTVDAFVGAGIRIQLYRQLYFDLGLHYQLTVYKTPIEMPYETVSLSPNEAVTQCPLVEYRQNGSERVHNIVSHFDGIKRNALKLNVGLLIKF